MKKTVIKLLVVCLLVSSICCGLTESYEAQTIDGKQPISPSGYQKLLGKGMDVDWSKTKKGRETYSKAIVQDFKKAGICHVRIRIKDDISEELFDGLDEQIRDCLSNGIIPIIAYQANGFKNSVSDEEMNKVVQWWTAMAEHYQNESYLLSFDMMIECTDALNKEPEKLNELYEKVVTAIRETNPKRILMMSPRVRSDAQYLNELKIPTQANGYMMAEWHFYAAGPSKENERKLWTTGTTKEKNLIRDKINLALKWQKKTGIPTWIGAWMSGNYNDGDDYSIKEQVIFAHFMVSELEKAGIPFAVNADSHFYDREHKNWIKKMIPLRDCIFSSYSNAVKTLFEESTNKISKITKKSSTSFVVEWTNLTWAKKYWVEISTSKSFKTKKSYTVTGNKKTISNLKKGTTYYVRVRGGYVSDKKNVYSKYSSVKVIK